MNGSRKSLRKPAAAHYDWTRTRAYATMGREIVTPDRIWYRSVNTLELLRALAALAEAPQSQQQMIASTLGLSNLPEPEDHFELFGAQLQPYASIYLGPEGMIGGPARERISEFFHVLQMEVTEECDHLATLLAIYANMGEAEAGAETGGERTQCRQVRTALFWEHICSWLPVYLLKVNSAGFEFYAQWSLLLIAALKQEAAALGQPVRISAHLLNQAEISDPRTHGLRPFVQSLLVPSITGVVITRAELAGQCALLGVNAHVAERIVTLEIMMKSTPKECLHWLQVMSNAAVAEYVELEAEFGETMSRWTNRARRSAALYQDLAQELAEPEQ